jgi:LysM repeat protein
MIGVAMFNIINKEDVIMKKGYRLLILMLMGSILIAFLPACQTIDHDKKKEAAVVAPPPVEKPKFIFHRVMEGETMGSIAKWYSGNEALWYELKEHNPDVDPFKLKKGDVLKVPADLAVVHSEQSPYSTASQKSRKAATKGSGTAKEVTPEVPDVFGPK